jgi:hypothetical protein
LDGSSLLAIDVDEVLKKSGELRRGSNLRGALSEQVAKYIQKHRVNADLSLFEREFGGLGEGGAIGHPPPKNSAEFVQRGIGLEALGEAGVGGVEEEDDVEVAFDFWKGIV